MTDQTARLDTPLPTRIKLAFGIGAVGETVYVGMFNTFIAIYYNQAIGLSNTLIGTAVLLALIGDAISDPAIGIISDRWKSRLGRRHPFLFFAPIPLALALWCIFNPPELLASKEALATTAGQWWLFCWLALWTILSRIFLTLYSIPHLALGGEIVRNHHERSQLFSINAMFGYAAGALFTFIAWSVFLAGETVGADGVGVSNHLLAKSYGPLALFAGATVLITIFLCAVGTYSRIGFLSAPAQNLERLTLLTFLAKILGTLKNRNYRFLLIGFFFFMISSGLYETFSIFVVTYFWELGPEEIRWIALAALPGVVVGAYLSPKLMLRFDRRPVLLGAIIGIGVFTQLVIDLRLLGWFPDNESAALLPILITNTFFFATMLGIGSVAVLSMLGDIIDENELATGLREEGLFYSARAFFAKMSGSVGHFVAGIMLDVFIKLPFEAVPGQVDEGVIFRLGIAGGPIMAAAATLSLVFYWRYDLPRTKHQHILRQLQERRTQRSDNSSPQSP
ncbi:MAG: MFS transporter [Pseudomonadaceae bacterium]|nr:MFS transporter [Pseudomonadaceae bacterium]